MAPQEPLHPLRVDNLGGIRKVLRGGFRQFQKAGVTARGAHGENGQIKCTSGFYS